MNSFFIIFFLSINRVLANINDAQYVSVELYNNSCSDIIFSDSILVPVKCNCFTTTKDCHNKIDKKIKFPDYLGHLEKYFWEKKKCYRINNQTYFNYHYLTSNKYCSRFNLIFSLIFILITIILGVTFYINFKVHRRRLLYQRLNEVELEEL